MDDVPAESSPDETGRMLFLPGISSLPSVRIIHRLRLQSHRQAYTEGNGE